MIGYNGDAISDSEWSSAEDLEYKYKKIKYKDIKKFTPNGFYCIDTEWKYLVDKVKNWEEAKDGLSPLVVNPDFQRGHVWTTEQQRKYLEYKICGGPGNDILYFNHPGWQSSYRGDFVLVDGLQRLTAIQKFCNNEISVFSGYFLDDFEDKNILLRSLYTKISVNSLKTRSEVLTWYIELNSGGVVHTKEEIERVKKLLEEENKK